MTSPRTIADACPHMSASVRRLNSEIVSPRNIRVPLSAVPDVDMEHDPHDVTPAKPTLRQKRGPKLNKTEAAFELYLRAAFPKSTVRAQDITLSLGNGVRYTPDFSVSTGDGAYLFYEVKGFMRDDAAVKLKVAASKYREFEFYLVFRDNSCLDGWRIEEVLA